MDIAKKNKPDRHHTLMFCEFRICLRKHGRTIAVAAGENLSRVITNTADVCFRKWKVIGKEVNHDKHPGG